MKSLIIKIICAVLLCALTLSVCACGEKNETEKPPKSTETCINGHTWELSDTTASCLSPGIETYKCIKCQETKTESVVAYGHNLIQTSHTAPTCKTTGSKVFTCTRCGYTETETLLTIPCDYQVKSTVPSTCTVKGSQLLECSMCHAQKTETLPLQEHNYQLINTIPSTCVVQGHNFYQCSDCTATKSELLPLANHQYKRKTVQATCFTHGGERDICSVCSDTKVISETPLLTHLWGSDNYCTHCGIYKTLFDVEKLNVDTEAPTSFLSVIKANLIPKFKSDNSIADEYWQSHTVTVKLKLYDSDDAIIGEKEFTSQIDKAGKLTVQSTSTTELQETRINMIFLRLYWDKAFDITILTDCNSFNMEIDCDGYDSLITQKYIVVKGDT